MKRSLTVDIAGQKLTLKTDADEAYVKSLARFVNAQIEDARKGAKIATAQSLAILAAMNIADDLFQAKRSMTDFKKRVHDKSKTMLALLEQGKELDG